MKTHIHETESGVVMQVLYEDIPPNVLEFKDVRVLDANYKPTGPDLTQFLHTVCRIWQEKGETIGESYLSVLVNEINLESGK